MISLNTDMTTLSEAMVTGISGLQLLTTLTFLVIIECIVALELIELRVPSHVALGTRASLSCRWALGPADMLYSVKWYKDGKEFFRHVPRDHEPKRKFPLPGVDVEQWNSSGSSLVLSPAVFDTGGRYRCEVSGERPLFPTVSGHADMEIVVLPERGPAISGLRSRYSIGDHVRVNCTSGRSRPSNQLIWYINGEPAPTTDVKPPVYQTYEDQLVITTLLLDFKLNESHFKRRQLKVKCLATLGTLYWRSYEESAALVKANVNNNVTVFIPVQKIKADRVHTNLAQLLNSSFPSIVTMLLAYLFLRFCYI